MKNSSSKEPLILRNVQVWSIEARPATIVAGFSQHGSVSIKLFYTWIDMVLSITGVWRLFLADDNGNPTSQLPLNPQDSNPLELGNYVILSLDREPLHINLTTESYRPRTLSLDISGTPTKTSFRDRVRARDNGCCVTRERVQSGYYGKFRASHIFPIAHRDLWERSRFSEIIQDDADNRVSIDSIQNGLLLRSDIHAMFDDYMFGVNPDDGYKSIDFMERGDYDGRTLWINTDINPIYRPSDDLLRDHLKQCVLANVKGAGRRREDWLDPEDDFDLSNHAVWGERLGNNQPSRLELEIRSRISHMPPTS